MNQTLYLNGLKADIYDKPITRKLQIGDISNPIEKKSSYSYTFKLPRTQNNTMMLDLIGVNGYNSLAPYIEIKADYIVDNIYMIRNGIAVIREVDSKEITVNLIDGVKALVDLIGDKLINQLDLSYLDHELTPLNVVNSFANLDAFIYCFAEYGQGFNTNDHIQNINKLAPCVYLHTIIDSIFLQSGLKIYGDFFTTDAKYLKELITPSKGFDISITGTTVRVSELLGEVKQIDLIKDLTYRYGLLIKPYNDGFMFKKIEEILNDTASSEDWTSKIADDIKENYVSEYARENKATYKYAANASENHDGKFLVDNFNAPITKSLFQSIYEIPEISGINGNRNYLPSKEVYKIPIWGGVENKTEDLNKSLVPISEINYKQLLNGNLVADANYKRKHYLVDIYNNFTGQYRRYRVTGSVVDAANAMVCYYDQDGIFISYEVPGTGVLTKKFRAALTVPVNTKYIGVMSLISAGESDLEEEETITYEVGKKSNTGIKLMFADNVVSEFLFQFYDPDFATPRYSVSAPFLSTRYNSLQQSIDKDYKAFTKLINGYKKISIDIGLSLTDIYNLDFFKLKYIKPTGRYYYLNNVQNTTGRVSKCELIEIKEFSKNEPPICYDIDKYVGMWDVEGYKNTIISKSNFLNNFYDKELDSLTQIKIINGFNANIDLVQNGVVLNSETIINLSDLNLFAVNKKFKDTTPNEFTQEYEYKVKDSGSGQFSEESAFLKINALLYLGGKNQDRVILDVAFVFGNGPEIILGQENEMILTAKDSYLFLLNPSENYYLKYFEFELISKPIGSTVIIEQQSYEDYRCSLISQGSSSDIGSYTVRLIGTSSGGTTNYKDYTFNIIEKV